MYSTIRLSVGANFRVSRSPKSYYAAEVAESLMSVRNVFVELAGNAAEQAVQARAYGSRTADDCNRDQCSDQAVLDCGSTRLVILKLCDQLHHNLCS